MEIYPWGRVQTSIKLVTFLRCIRIGYAATDDVSYYLGKTCLLSMFLLNLRYSDIYAPSAH